jgi:hypothetical protein
MTTLDYLLYPLQNSEDSYPPTHICLLISRSHLPKERSGKGQQLLSEPVTSVLTYPQTFIAWKLH